VAIPALIAQAASYEATGPVLDTLGAALTGYRTTATAVTAGDLADGDHAILTIYKGTDGAPAANFLVWYAKWDNGNSQWTRVAELEAGGTISDEDDVVFYVSGVEQLLFGVDLTNRVSPVTTGEKFATDVPFSCRLTRIYASAKTAPATQAVTIDVEDEGTSVLNAVLSVATSANNASTSTFASSATSYALTKGDLLSIDIDQADDGTAREIYLYLFGYLT